MTSAAVVEKSITNILWSFFSLTSVKILNFMAILVLARLLTPTEFGLMALCLVVQHSFETVSRFGLGASLISADRDSRRMEDSVFGFSLAASALMAAAMWAASPLLAGFMEEPALTPMLRVTCLALLIDGLSTVPNNLLQRELRFRAKTVPDICRGLAKGIVSITLALLDFGVWALIWGYIIGSMVNLIALFAVRPWLPSGPPRRAETTAALRFGTSLLGAELLSVLSRNVDGLLISKILGFGALGIFNQAQRLPDLAVGSLDGLSAGVTHPMMAGMRDSREALVKYYYGCLRYMSVITLPAGVALAAAADPLVRTLYNPTWYGMIVPMQLVAIAAGLSTVNVLPGVVYKAINEPHHLLRAWIVVLPLTIGTLWLATPYGLEAVGLAKLAVPFLFFVPHFLIIRSRLGVGLLPTLDAIRPAIICAAATAAAGFGAAALVGGPPLVQLAAIGIPSATAYLLTLRLVAPEVYVQLWTMVARKLGRIPAK